MSNRYFVTGISTEVGKTVASAILVEALFADYWKPIQSGDLHNTDTHQISKLITNTRSRLHPSSYSLQSPVSPHEAARRDGIRIDISKIKEPETENMLVIEGAGGLLVPLNDDHYVLDLIKPRYKVIVVSKHYLGSINHTLLTLEALNSRKLEVAGLIFNGNTHPSTESIIIKKSGVSVLARIQQEPNLDRNTILRYAAQLRKSLNS